MDGSQSSRTGAPRLAGFVPRRVALRQYGAALDRLNAGEARVPARSRRGLEAIVARLYAELEAEAGGVVRAWHPDELAPVWRRACAGEP